jgi:hypothetical protein
MTEIEKKYCDLLVLLGSIKSTRWHYVQQIVPLIKEGQIIDIHKSWADDFRQKYPETYPLDLSKISTWSTFDETCVDLRFFMEKNNLKCDVKIYDGNSFDGYRTNLRFTAKLLLPIYFIEKLSEIIDGYFDDYLENQHEKYLEEQKKRWINNLKIQILNNTK